jgi:plastocyanin
MQKRIVMVSLAVASAALILLSGCTKAGSSTSPYGATSAPPAAAQPNTVVIANIAFGPASITVPAGTTITWQNNDGINHTSTSDSGVWDTGAIPPGGSKTHTFDAAGTFPYHCNIHTMMTGTVIVQ